jgi:uncharacterized Zn-binding protein involved in type VI secretion
MVSVHGGMVSPRRDLVSLHNAVVSRHGAKVSLNGAMVSLNGAMVSLNGAMVNLNGAMVSLNGAMVSLNGAMVNLRGDLMSFHAVEKPCRNQCISDLDKGGAKTKVVGTGKFRLPRRLILRLRCPRRNFNSAWRHVEPMLRHGDASILFLAVLEVG